MNSTVAMWSIRFSLDPENMMVWGKGATVSGPTCLRCTTPNYCATHVQQRIGDVCRLMGTGVLSPGRENRIRTHQHASNNARNRTFRKYELIGDTMA